MTTTKLHEAVSVLPGEESGTLDITRALRDQWTPTVARLAQQYAERRARLVRASGRPCPPLAQYARELVHDAHADTWSRRRAWDPRRYTLLHHLCGVITTRTLDEIRSARRFCSLDAPTATNDNDADSSERQALADRLAGSAETSPVSSTVRLTAIVTRVCELLRERTSDPRCIAIVSAWEQGFTARDEVRRHTGLDEVAYRRARERLSYSLGELPAVLRQIARDCLRDA